MHVDELQTQKDSQDDIYVNSLEFTLGQKAGRKLGKLGSCEIQILQLSYDSLGQCQWYVQHVHAKKFMIPF